MSTAEPINPGGLYAVPAPSQKERFALLLRLRRAARQAFDTLLALPRGAAGWVLTRAQAALSAIGGSPVWSRIATGLTRVRDLFRSVGPVTAAAAVLSIPAVWRATVRVGRWLGSKIGAGAKALWQQTRSLLGKLGPTGNRIATGLVNTGTAVQRAFVAVVAHPVTQALVEGARSLAVLVRPVSQSTVVHRLLGRLVGGTWLRWGLELVLLPLVIAPSLLADLFAGWRTTWTPAAASASQPAQPSAPFVSVPEAGMGDETVEPEYPTGSDKWAEPHGPSNRAERRAQQAQARARRARARY
ncbi:hypothetical protein [Intrasporangium sp. YIM S08009]|uniref:hypothetical protein n=1 Tax=Intrasporangium zincisolvens TaxID=3080018 RepID=UPI002B05D653|nr:hypothetical protein [Intrasporangium sp. YIM S08009]